MQDVVILLPKYNIFSFGKNVGKGFGQEFLRSLVVYDK